MVIGIITIIDNDNYGNRLQNYALYETLTNFHFDVITIKNESFTNTKKFYLLRLLKNAFRSQKVRTKRTINFESFNKNIKFSEKKINAFSKYKKYDFVIVGSDQVWNPNFGRLREVDLLTNVKPSKRIAYAGSFGISTLPTKYKHKAMREFTKFKAISVRENQGKKIIQELTDRKDIEVVLDPTMLLTANEWNAISKEPEQIKLLHGKKYILSYFLGNLSLQRKNEIERIAKENDCEIINLLDNNSPFYSCGPSEFVYLEKNAFLICTDSFHSCVFAILFNKPFVVLKREDDTESMNSRIDTLLGTFKLTNRYSTDIITNELLSCDYTNAMKILEKEKEKSINFLKKALEIAE